MRKFHFSFHFFIRVLKRRSYQALDGRGGAAGARARGARLDRADRARAPGAPRGVAASRRGAADEGPTGTLLEDVT